MKKLISGLVMLIAVPVILAFSIWGEAIVSHFTNTRPALTACSDWGSVLVEDIVVIDENGDEPWLNEELVAVNGDLVWMSHEDMSGRQLAEFGLRKKKVSMVAKYCSPLLPKYQVINAELSASGNLSDPIMVIHMAEITNDGRYENNSVDTYSLDVANFVRALVILALIIGGAVLVFGTVGSKHHNKVNEIQMSNDKTGDV
jgi:hypothetical protein